MKALFVCVQNAGRSQIAQALYQRLGGEGRSAGTEPAKRVHREVVTAMRELGIDLEGREPRELSRQDVEWADVVVTMGCGDRCPFVPGKWYVDWDLEDPKGKRLEDVRRIRDEIERRVAELAAAPVTRS